LSGRLDTAGEGAIGEACVEEVARSKLCGGSDEGAIGVEDEGVSAFEDGERGEREEARFQGAEGDGGAVEEAFGSAVEVSAEGEEALAGLSKGLARVVAENRGC
jgi:hypothetical protein